jgi:hypothetical protein
MYWTFKQKNKSNLEEISLIFYKFSFELFEFLMTLELQLRRL